MAFRVQVRRDTGQRWSLNNPILLNGEMGFNINTTQFKIGDGTTPWNSLSYWSGGIGPTGPTGSIGPIGITGPTGPTGSAGYKVYTALLTQTGQDAPVAIVLENTIGAIVWTRNNPGEYTGTLNNSFPENKTFITYTHDNFNGDTGYPGGVRIDNNQVGLTFNDGLVNPGQFIDIGINAIESIEIRVYN